MSAFILNLHVPIEHPLKLNTFICSAVSVVSFPVYDMADAGTVDDGSSDEGVKDGISGTKSGGIDVYGVVELSIASLSASS